MAARDSENRPAAASGTRIDASMGREAGSGGEGRPGPLSGRGGRPLRVAIACPGVGVVRRGFERLFSDIFREMRPHLDITLFKGGGRQGGHEKVLHFFRRGGRMVKLLPLHKLAGRTPYHTECLTFALALLPHLRDGVFDVVHTTDPPLTRLLYRMRSRLGLEFRLLYTEGCAMPPGDYPPADHIQQIARVTYDDAVAYGHRAETMTLLPCGFDSTQFAVTNDRAALRAAYGITADTRVILSVAALNRGHKRTDHLVDEVARVRGDVVLWLAGSLDHGEPDLVEYARARLGKRVRITEVPFDKVRDLYHLADVMVHAATFEAFGLAIVEAAACGAPVLAHDAPHFAWLLGEQECLVDMMRPGALAARLQELLAHPAQLDRLRRADYVRRHFAWDVLRTDYLDLYHRVAR